MSTDNLKKQQSMISTHRIIEQEKWQVCLRKTRLGFQHPLKPSPNNELHFAFMNAFAWRPYFNILNELFVTTRTSVIHDAKTIAVADVILKLSNRRHFNIRQLYVLTSLMFEYPSAHRLSKLVDLYDLKSFTSSIEKIRLRHFCAIDDPELTAPTSQVSGFGTLDLFGIETYVFKNDCNNQRKHQCI